MELYLDPCVIKPIASEPVSVDYRKADNLVQERASFHYFQGHPCVVVTLDEEVSQDLSRRNYGSDVF